MLFKFLIFGVMFLPVRLFSQEISLAELAAISKMDDFGIDTLLKKKGYRLMQKDLDSVSRQFYYSHLERNDDGPSWVRGLSYMDVDTKSLSSRVLTYRTYNREEYQRMMAALLAQGYTTKNVFNLKNATHTMFDNGKMPVLVKVTNNRMKKGLMVKSYEFELGR